MSIAVLPPDINESHASFSTAGHRIRFGLSAVKNVGINVVSALVAEREKSGPFRDFVDFCERLAGRDLNKKTVESLIKCGAFDSFGIFRSRLMAQYEFIIDSVNQTRRSILEGQFSLFDAGASAASGITVEWPAIPEYDPRLLMAMEKEMLGLYLSGHPLDSVSDLMRQHATVTSRDFQPVAEEGEPIRLKDGQPVVVAGIITEMKSISTRNNKMMAFLTLEDLYGQFEVIVFPAILETHAQLLSLEQPVWVEGRVSVKEEEVPKILAERLLALVRGGSLPGPIGRGKGGLANHGFPVANHELTQEPASSYKPGSSSNTSSPETARLKVRLPVEIRKRDRLAVHALLRYFDGTVPAYVYENGSKSFSDRYSVEPASILTGALVNLLGSENIKLEN